MRARGLSLALVGFAFLASAPLRGQDVVTEAAPARALDDAALRAACFDLLGRPQYAGTITYQLAANGTTIATVTVAADTGFVTTVVQQ